MADKVGGDVRITRRDFLKFTGIAGALAVLGLGKGASALPKSGEKKTETTRTLSESIDNLSRLPTQDNLPTQERKSKMVEGIAELLKPLVQSGRLDDTFISSDVGDTSSATVIGVLRPPRDVQQDDFTPFGPGLIKSTGNVREDYNMRFAGIGSENALKAAMGDRLPPEVSTEFGNIEYDIPISTPELIGILHKLKENGQLEESLADPLSEGMERLEGSIDFRCLGKGILLQGELAGVYDETIKDIVGADIRDNKFLVDIDFGIELRNGLWALDVNLTIHERQDHSLQYILNLRFNENGGFTLDIQEPPRRYFPDKDEMVKRKVSDLSPAVIVPPILKFALHSLCSGETKQYI